MIELTVYTFICFAIAWIAGHAKASYGIRLALSKAPLGFVIVSLLECFGCLGFWLGIGAWFLKCAPSPLNHWWEAALFTSASSLLLARLAGIADSSPPEGGGDRS